MCRAGSAAIMQPDPAGRGIDELVADLHADPVHGLTAQEAQRRLARDGPNELRAAGQVPAWLRMLMHFQDPLVYLLLGATGISLVAWMFEGRQGWPVDAIVISVIVIFNAVLGHVQEAKARQAVEALARMTASTTAVVRGGQVQRVPAAGLVVGDLLVLGEGDAVGADARLVRAYSLHLNEASLTGESEAVAKGAARQSASGAQAGQADQPGMVFKGTSVTQGSGLALVTATGMNTRLGSIATLLDATAEEPTPLEEEISYIGRMLGISVVVIAVVVVATILLISRPQSAAGLVSVLLMGVALAVAAVPEGLPAILSVVLALGVQRMARHKAIVKNLSSVETLGSTSVICTDKTGTLTRSEMTVERVMTASGDTRVTGVGYTPEGHMEHDGSPVQAGPLHEELVAVLGGGSLAGNAVLQQGKEGAWEIHGDPTEAAFLVAERKLGIDAARSRRFERLGVIPFTSVRKLMSTIEADRDNPGQAVLVTKGAPDVLLRLCTRVRVGRQSVPLDDARRAKIMADVDTLSDAALRTLSVAWRTLAPGEDIAAGASLEREMEFAGTVGIFDPPREEAGVAIAQAHRAGIRVIMITGDHPRTALRIAQDLGIARPGAAALSGADLEALDDAALALAVQTTNVFARVAPVHKLRIVAALQAGGSVVAMTGDGVNDAPALKAADIGVAMGVSGTEVAKEAARMILADDNFATIVQAVREGRSIFDNIRKSLRYLLSSNMGEVLTVFLGVVGAGVIGLGAPGAPLVLPLLATQILWLNLITDSWPALAMGLDPPGGKVMSRSPRPPAERIINAAMWWQIAGIGIIVSVTTLLTMDMYLPGGLIEGTRDLANARTAGFTVLVFAHLFNCFNTRSEADSAFEGMFSNPWIWGAVALSSGLQVAVVHLEVLNLAFGTAPLTLDQWLVCAAMGSVVLWFGELRKWVARHGRPTAG